MTTNRTGTNRDSDYMKQMAQKIKKQAEQLHELGNYKSLCEKRIVELVPGHPLPILPIHLGNRKHFFLCKYAIALSIIPYTLPNTYIWSNNA